MKVEHQRVSSTPEFAGEHGVPEIRISLGAKGLVAPDGARLAGAPVGDLLKAQPSTPAMLTITEPTQLTHSSAAALNFLNDPIGVLTEFHGSRSLGNVRKLLAHLVGIEGDLVLLPARRHAGPLWPGNSRDVLDG